MTTLISGFPRDTICSCFLIAGVHPIPSRHGEKARGSLQMKLVGGENYTEDQPTFGRGQLVYPRLIRGKNRASTRNSPYFSQHRPEKSFPQRV